MSKTSLWTSTASHHWVFWTAKILRTSPTAPSVSVLFILYSSDRWSDQKAWPQHCRVSEEKEKANCLKSRGRCVYSHIPAPQAWCLHDFLCVIWLFALSRTELLAHLCSCQSCESAFIIVILLLVPQGRAAAAWRVAVMLWPRQTMQWEGRDEPSSQTAACACVTAELLLQLTGNVHKTQLGFCPKDDDTGLLDCYGSLIQSTVSSPLTWNFSLIYMTFATHIHGPQRISLKVLLTPDLFWWLLFPFLPKQVSKPKCQLYFKFGKNIQTPQRMNHFHVRYLINMIIILFFYTQRCVSILSKLLWKYLIAFLFLRGWIHWILLFLNDPLIFQPVPPSGQTTHYIFSCTTGTVVCCMELSMDCVFVMLNLGLIEVQLAAHLVFISCCSCSRRWF